MPCIYVQHTILLIFQEFELCKALDENQSLIEKGLNKQSPGELKLTQEMNKLSKRLTQLNSDLEKVSQQGQQL